MESRVFEKLVNAPVGSRVKFAEEKQRYTIQARDERYIICTKPFNLQRTVLYTIICLRERIRGTDNLVFGYGYETREECQSRLADLNKEKNPTEISYRNRIPLIVESVEVSQSSHHSCVIESRKETNLIPTFDEEYSRINKELDEFVDELNSGRVPEYSQELLSLADEILKKLP